MKEWHDPGIIDPKSCFGTALSVDVTAVATWHQRLDMPTLCARRLALPVYVNVAQAQCDSPVNTPMGPHTTMATNTSNVAAFLPCLLHNKITGLQRAKGGARQIGCSPCVSKP